MYLGRTQNCKFRQSVQWWEDLGHVQEGHFLMDHKSNDSYLGSTAVIELDGTLGRELGLLPNVTPSKVNIYISVTEITNILVATSLNVTHEGALQPSNEGNDLNKASGRDRARSKENRNTVGEGVKGVSKLVNISREVEFVACHDLSKEEN